MKRNVSWLNFFNETYSIFFFFLNLIQWNLDWQVKPSLLFKEKKKQHKNKTTFLTSTLSCLLLANGIKVKTSAIASPTVISKNNTSTNIVYISNQ